MKHGHLSSTPLLLSLFLTLSMWGCGGKSPVPSPRESLGTTPSQAVSRATPGSGEKVDFFPTAERARNDVASLIQLSQSRVDATFSAAEDSVIREEEEGHLAELLQQENATFQDLIVTLDSFLQLVPAGGKMDQNLTRGRNNAAAKYESYSRSVDAGIADQFLDALEKTAIESNARSLTTELQFIESSLPLPFDSLKVGPTFVVEADSVDLFFEVMNDITDMSEELEQLRARVAEYQKSKVEMEAFLEREKALSEDIQESQTEIEQLNLELDTARSQQRRDFAMLGTKLGSQGDSLGKVIRQVDADVQFDLSNLASGIADSITVQREQSDSLFFQMGTNLEVFREEVDSLKGVVRYYDIAEKGLPELDEDILNILRLPQLRHKVTLKNGTVVVGQILAENLDVIVMQTAVGNLVIDKDEVSRYDEKFFPGPRVEFEGDYQMIQYPDREEFMGQVRNVGKKTADFVKVTFYLWDATTNPVGVGSAFVDGEVAKFETGVISDASITPGERAKYYVIVKKQPGRKVAYRTNELKWREFKK